LTASSRQFFAVLLLAGIIGAASPARGQGVDVANRPIAKVSIEGVKEVQQQLVLNQLTTKPGQPYDPDIVAQDIQNITRLGRFSRVSVRVEPAADGTVGVTFVVQEQPLLADAQVIGNKKFSDQEILDKVMLRAGDARDSFLIERGKDEIRKMYREAGYFLADVGVDEDTLNETGILILRVREGPRVKVRATAFEGNVVFASGFLASKIQTSTYIPIFRKGVLSREQLDGDVAKLRDFYQEQGYLDVRVGRRVDLSDDQRDARVVFVVDEGRRYTVASIKVDGNTLYPTDQVQAAMALKLGDVFSMDRLKATQESLADLYGKLGYIETRVQVQRVFDPVNPTVDLTVRINESRQYAVGSVIVRGNALTQDKIVRRQVRGIEPGRAYDSTGVPLTERRIKETGLFSESKVTILGDPKDEVRDALVEVKEANTGSVSFGAAVSSDSGIFGAIDLTQRNFDITDTPESWGEFFSGRAFRGAGQYFNLTLQPGQEFQRYQVNFRDPYFLDTDFFLDTSAFFYTRQREDWDETRIGGSVGLGKRFGDVWSANIKARAEQVDVHNLKENAPIDAFAQEGTSLVDGLGFFLTRSTVDSRFFPTHGTRTEFGVEQSGLIGDFSFTRVTAEWHGYVTVDEDFFGRRTVLSFRAEAGYLFGAQDETVKDALGNNHQISEIPLYERFYAGGHRTFRGFDFRGVGPRGIRNDNGKLGSDPVGGEFMLLLGSEYNFPIYEKIVRGVVFVDSGTVQDKIGVDQFRVSIGTGIRLALPFFGQAPFAFDIAIPIVKQDGDRTRFFSFDIALPF
jgi:outer membrane protein insertion porin family